MNTLQTNEVAMKVNQANLVKSLRFSFTNSTTVISELMQNTRRAQATQVNFNFCPETKTLQVRDNGCGIDSIESLLAVAESGWDAELIALEHCFGIGFLSALFACRHISVISKSGSIAVDTDEILTFKPVTIHPVYDWDGMTVITLSVLTAVKTRRKIAELNGEQRPSISVNKKGLVQALFVLQSKLLSEWYFLFVSLVGIIIVHTHIFRRPVQLPRQFHNRQSIMGNNSISQVIQ